MILGEQALLEFKIILEKLVTKREGMIAENKQREYLDEPPAYNDASFEVITEKMAELRRELVALGKR